MNKAQIARTIKLLAAGVVLLQAGGCDTTSFLDFVQTVLLGVTAAGSVAIIQNI